MLPIDTQTFDSKTAPHPTVERGAVPTVQVKRAGGAPGAGSDSGGAAEEEANAVESARLASWATAGGGEPILAD